MSKLDRIKFLYHFTDDRNLPSIRKHGLLSWAELIRRGIEVPAPGGNDWSHEADHRHDLDNYVHLCFRTNHPMEWRAKQDSRIINSTFLRIDASVLKIRGVRFTPDVSNKAGVESMPIADAEELIDYDILYTRVESSDWKQRLGQSEKYEVLVPKHIPLGFIGNI
jgi:hypothetical protein